MTVRGKTIHMQIVSHHDDKASVSTSARTFTNKPQPDFRLQTPTAHSLFLFRALDGSDLEYCVCVLLVDRVRYETYRISPRLSPSFRATQCLSSPTVTCREQMLWLSAQCIVGNPRLVRIHYCIQR